MKTSKISKEPSDINFDLDYLIDYKRLRKDKIDVKGELIKIANKDKKGDDIIIGKVYTLYGEFLEEFINTFIDPTLRAEDLANTALRTEEIYKILFNRVKEDDFIFNKLVLVDKYLPLTNYIKKLKSCQYPGLRIFRYN